MCDYLAFDGKCLCVAFNITTLLPCVRNFCVRARVCFSNSTLVILIFIQTIFLYFSAPPQCATMLLICHTPTVQCAVCYVCKVWRQMNDKNNSDKIWRRRSTMNNAKKKNENNCSILIHLDKSRCCSRAHASPSLPLASMFIYVYIVYGTPFHSSRTINGSTDRDSEQIKSTENTSELCTENIQIIHLFWLRYFCSAAAVLAFLFAPCLRLPCDSHHSKQLIAPTLSTRMR